MSDLLGSSSSDTPFLAGADSATENRLLRRIIEATSADLDIREVSQRVAALMTEATGADVCFVHLVDEERGRVVLCGATPPFDEVVGTVELALGEGIAGWVAQHAEPAVVPDKWKDARYKYIPALRGEDYTSMMSVPMLAQGRVVGVLNVHAKTTRRWDDQDVALMSDVANNLARAVENSRLYARLAQREEMLENFATRTVEAQELERRRLAGEIHDGISQRLISLWYHLLAAEDAVAGLDGDATPAASAAPNAERLRSELGEAKQLATDALSEARAAITGLRPAVLDDLGLGPSLESLARSLSGVTADLDIIAADLPPHVEMALYRIAQEALHNVVRHSGANNVTVVFGPTEDGGARLVVADDGQGLPEEWMAVAEDRGAYGMVGMRERAELIGADLSINSRPGLGTTVEVTV
ncbi:MAG: GAF domain-containing sensor histidine kinase [Acidimicrobiales bacterium]